jgi:hypothetical protein
MLAAPVDGDFDAAYALDVLKYIDNKQEDDFLHKLRKSLTAGVAIFGIPSLESQTHASLQSKAGHVIGRFYQRGIFSGTEVRAPAVDLA